MTEDGDFLVVLRFVGRLVQWVLELALDILCLIILLLPLVLPWRAVAVWLSSPDATNGGTYSGNGRSAFRWWAVMHFGAALFDMIAIPVALAACCAPTRIAVIAEGTWGGLHERLGEESTKRIRYHCEVRIFWIEQFIEACIDVPCLLLGIVAVFHPWRTIEVLRGTVSIASTRHPRLATGRDVESVQRRWKKTLKPMRRWWAACGSQCPLDWFAWTAALASVVMPTRIWPLVSEACSALRAGGDLFFHYTGGRRFGPMTPWEELRELCWQNLMFALLDIVAMPFCMLALLSGTRTGKLLRSFRLSLSGHPLRLSVIGVPGVPGSARLQLKEHDMGRPMYQGAREEAEHTSTYMVVCRDQTWCLVQGGDDGAPERILATAQDTADSPEKVPNHKWVVVDTRLSGIQMCPDWPACSKPIAFGGTSYNCAVRVACLWHGVQAVADLLFLPLLLLCIASVYRAPPLVRALESRVPGRSQAARSNRSSKMHLGVRMEAIRQSALLCLDIMALPGLMLLLLTCYRSRGPLRRLGRNFDRFGLSFHSAVLRNVAIVLHDVLVLVPLLLLLGVTAWRLPPVLAAWRSQLGRGSGGQGELPGLGADSEEHELLTQIRRLEDMERGTEWAELTGEAAPPEPGHAPALSTAEQEAAAVARRELAEADMQWGALAGVPLTPAPALEPSFPGPVRRSAWRAGLDLVVDLPCVLAGTVTCLCLWRANALWRRCRRGSATERRRAALSEGLRTFRDLLVLPLLILLLATLYRLPLVLAQLWSHRSPPLAGDAECRVLRCRVHLRSRGGAVAELRVEGGRAVAPGSLRLRVLGSAFWQEVAAAFGGGTAAVAQGMLPFALKGPRQTDAYEVLDASNGGGGGNCGPLAATFSITLEAKVKRGTVIKKLRNLGDVCARFQIEGQDRETGCAVLLATVVFRMSDLASALAAQQGEGEFVAVPCLESDIDAGEYAGIVDSFWLVVVLEFAQLMLDVVHLLLLAPILCVPWRAVSLLVAACEPKDRWPVRVGKKAARAFRTSEWLLDRFLVGFQHACNDQLKSPSVAHDWCQRGDPPVRQARGQDLSTHSSISRSLRGAAVMMDPEHAEMLLYCLDLNDARVYHLALRAYANCLLATERITVEEHAIILLEITRVEATLAQRQEGAYQSMQGSLAHAWQAALARGRLRKWGLWHKDLGTLRIIVRSMALMAVVDVLGLLLFSLLLVTVYRVPSAIAGLKRERVWSPIRSRFRIIVAWHLRACGEDLLLVAQVTLLAVLLVATIVRIPEALCHASRATALRELRSFWWADLKDAVGSLHELLSLLAFWRTYSLAFRAIGHSALVAPACLCELAAALCPCLPLCPRFGLGCAAFAALCCSPFLGTTGRWAFWAGLGAALLAGAGAAARRAGAAAVRGWSSPVLRLSWSNAVALAAVAVEPTALVAALATLPDAGQSGPLLGGSARSRVCGAVVPAVAAGSAATGAWLLLVSLMFVTGQLEEHKALQTNALLRFLQLLLSHALCVPITLCLLLPSACATSLQAPALVVLAVYSITTQALSAECGLLEPPPGTCGIDLRYPARYMAGASLLSFGMALACMLGSKGALFGVMALALASIAWILVYSCVSGGAPVSCIPYAAVLRAAGSAGVLATAVFVTCRGAIDAALPNAVLWLVLAAIGVLATAVALIQRAVARHQRQKELERSGIREDCSRLLLQTGSALSTGGTVLSGEIEAWQGHWRQAIHSAKAPQQLALQLVAFEKHILAQRLTSEFLQRRLAWRSALMQVREFAALRQLAAELHDGLRTPPTHGNIHWCTSQALGRVDLAQTVVDFVVGYRELRVILEPVLFCARSAKKPKEGCKALCGLRGGGGLKMSVHFRSARMALDTALRRFRAEDSCRNLLGRARISRSRSSGIGVQGYVEGKVGHVRIYMVGQDSAPCSYWPHIKEMLTRSERFFDTHGDPHATLPVGLPVAFVRP